MGLLKNIFGNRHSDLHEFIGKGAVIVDVRTPDEFNAGHIKGSKNIPLQTLQNRWEELRDLNKPVITVCQSGMRSGNARSFLEQKGLKVINGGSWLALNRIV